MFALTADHFETVHQRQPHHRYTSVCKPFFAWFDLLQNIYGYEAMIRAFEIVENEIGDGQDVGQLLYNRTPEQNLEVFNRVVEKIKNG